MKYTFFLSCLLFSVRAQAQDVESIHSDFTVECYLRQIDSIASQDIYVSELWEFFAEHAVFIDERNGDASVAFTLRDSMTAPYVGVSIAWDPVDTGSTAKLFDTITPYGVFSPPFLVDSIGAQDTSFISLDYQNPVMDSPVYRYLATLHEAIHFSSYYIGDIRYRNIKKWIAAQEAYAHTLSFQSVLNQFASDTAVAIFQTMVYAHWGTFGTYTLAFQNPLKKLAEDVHDMTGIDAEYIFVMAEIFATRGGRRGDRQARKILEENGMVSYVY